MKKEKNISKNLTIDQFQFHITPISIQFTKIQSNTFYIYIEKGAQVLGKVDQQINGLCQQYRFRKQHVKKFRIANDKNLTYQWSIYRFTDDEEEQYLESINFNIKNRYQEYIAQFQKIQLDLYRIYNQKQKKTELQEIWKDLRYDLTKNQVDMSCTFSKLNARINFKIKIKCELDFMHQRWEDDKQKRKLQKNIIANRRASIDSRNSRNKSSDASSALEIKQKNQQVIQSFSIKKQEPLFKQQQANKNKQNQEQQEIRQSQIRVTSPQGVDLTSQIPQKFSNHKKAIDEDFIYNKKPSMLSDIIQQSYEGSSNFNLTKSNQGERLKSIDTIQQVQQTKFSPLIKTQTFESEKHEQYFNGIKRTATLAQKSSQQFDIDQTPKNNSKKSSAYFSSKDPKYISNQHQNDKDNIFVSENVKTSSRLSSQIEQQQKQIIQDFSQAKNLTIKNVIKILIIVSLLILVLNVFNLFGEKPKTKKIKVKNHKTHKKHSRQSIDYR